MIALSVILIAALIAHIAASVAATSILVRRIEESYPPLGAFVAVKGGRLHLYDIPAKNREARSPILLLHGATANARDMMVGMAAPLSQHHRVIAIDRPGHGWSERPGGEADADPARQAALIVEAMDGLGVGKAVVVGYSWSGALAAALALDHKDRVAGLVLVSAVTHPWPGGIDWHYDLAARPLLGFVFVRTVMTPLGACKFRSGVKAAFDPQDPVANYAEATAAALVLRPAEFRWNAKDVAALLGFVEILSKRYGKIDVPTAVITGDADKTVSPDLHSKAIAKQIPGARLTLLPGVGHMPHHVAKDVVIAEIERVAKDASKQMRGLEAPPAY